jgi:hypothetical protein
MTAALIIGFILIIAATFFLYRRLALPAPEAQRFIEPSQFRGLFDDPVFEANDIDLEQRNDLLERAARGDTQSLIEAKKIGDKAFYDQTLDKLSDWTAGCQENLQLLVLLISKEELRASPRLAEQLMRNWSNAPDKRSTIEMIHIAALSDDAAIFQRAIESALQLWKKKKLPELGAAELRDVVESQYWVLASEARQSGAGFTLKRKLIDVRRELATTPAR